MWRISPRVDKHDHLVTIDDLINTFEIRSERTWHAEKISPKTPFHHPSQRMSPHRVPVRHFVCPTAITCD